MQYIDINYNVSGKATTLTYLCTWFLQLISNFVSFLTHFLHRVCSSGWRWQQPFEVY